MTFNINKFDITSIPDDSVVVFLGARRTGKSFCLKNLLYYHKDIPIATIMSGTELANRFFGNFVPSVFIHEDFSVPLIDNVVNRQKKIKKKIERSIQKTGKSDIDPRAVLILDDLMFDTSWIKNRNIREMFMNGRHWHVLFMITLQFPLGIPPVLRSNIDYVFIHRENNINNRRRLYDNYASMFPTFEMFCTIMDQCTENYECLVIKKNTDSNKLQDQVFWYKAEDNGSFKMGAKFFWDAQKEVEEESDEDDGMFDVSSYKKTKCKLAVNKRK